MADWLSLIMVVVLPRAFLMSGSFTVRILRISVALRMAISSTGGTVQSPLEPIPTFHIDHCHSGPFGVITVASSFESLAEAALCIESVDSAFSSVHDSQVERGCVGGSLYSHLLTSLLESKVRWYDMSLNLERVSCYRPQRSYDAEEGGCSLNSVLHSDVSFISSERVVPHDRCVLQSHPCRSQVSESTHSLRSRGGGRVRGPVRQTEAGRVLGRDD